MKRIGIVVLTIILVATVTVMNRHWVLLQLASLVPIELLIEKQDEGPNVSWHDDYYTLEWLDSRTVAIGEPLYYQQNINYLIIGDERAVLFDAGSGLRSILPVAEQLTDKPITFIPSHFHYDHLGDGLPFDHIAVADLPHISHRADNGVLALKWHEHLGAAEGYATPTFEIDEWLKPGDELDLGNRKLTVIYTPGHTNDSISLFDPAADFLFSGDFIYQGPLFAFLPNSSLGDYEQGANHILEGTTKETKIYGAHRIKPPGVPVLRTSDVNDLKAGLANIRNGTLAPSGIYPAVYPINGWMDLWTEPGFLQNWEITYPD